MVVTGGRRRLAVDGVLEAAGDGVLKAAGDDVPEVADDDVGDQVPAASLDYLN